MGLFTDIKDGIRLDRYSKDRKGATAVVFAIAFPVIIGAFALTTEMGYWFYSKSKLQNTADLAALAGAKQYVILTDIPDSKIAVIADARDNSFDPDSGTLTSHIPPIDGSYAGKPAVQVLIRQEVPTFFVKMFKPEPVYANVRAVAAIVATSSEACLLALSPSGTGIKIGGDVDVTLRGCVMHANSTDSQAINVFGSSELIAGCTSSVGETRLQSDWTFDECSSAWENQPVIADPFAHIDVPDDISSLACYAPSMIGMKKDTGKDDSSGSVTFPNPGGGVVRFCNDMEVNGDVTLEPGTYVFDGADLDFASKATLSGDGVTVIFMNNGELGKLNNNNGLFLDAPTSGDYSGIAMFSDRDTMGYHDWKINGQADVSIGGALYLPTIELEYVGGADTLSTECTQIVAYKVSFLGNSSLESDCSDYGLDPIAVNGLSDDVKLVE